MSGSRPAWDEYFFSLAKAAATRATCLRRKVGCVIVQGKQVVALGYNGSPPGEEHCLDVGCLMDNNHCIRTTHAEANAIAQAARHGVKVEGATAYVTLEPCRTCAKLLLSAGVAEVKWAEAYGPTKLSASSP